MPRAIVKTPRWDRSSQLALEALLLLVMVGSTLAAVVPTINSLINREVTFEAPLLSKTVEAGGGATVQTADGVVTMAGASVGQVLLNAAPDVLTALVVASAGYYLYLVIRSLRAGDPFHRRNATRLTTAALIVLIGGLLASGVGAFSTLALSMDAQDALGQADWLVAGGSMALVPPVALGLLLVCLAEFFRRGTELRDDVDGLV